MKLIFFRFNRRGLPLPHTCVYESGILLRQRFTDSLAPYTIRQSRHPPQKDVQQPRDFICFTSHWMNLIYTDIRSLRSSDERYAVSWLTDLTNGRRNGRTGRIIFRGCLAPTSNSSAMKKSITHSQSAQLFPSVVANTELI